MRAAIPFSLLELNPLLAGSASTNSITCNSSSNWERTGKPSAPVSAASQWSCSASSAKNVLRFASSQSCCSLNEITGHADDEDDTIDEEAEYCGNTEKELFCGNGISIQVIKLGNRSRRIQSNIVIDASLHTVWDILTDYERLADFIPGLAVSQLLERTENYARIFQIGQQNLVLGLKFTAKGIIDCYEKDLEILSFGHRRIIEFKMIEGDFLTFKGKWSIEQYKSQTSEATRSMGRQEFDTILSYMVDVEPNIWLPIRLVEGRLCREIKANLSSIREEAQRSKQHAPPAG
ncbi:hypothetical protein Nepgr_022775 [Nepenthes gracilis]|uniref:Coenzyme Q-binding protein COQ10 START domain-containing protein n=1 Tax=Nepenthes gracilis TaxID=150966 RepID=A0AAD3T0X8_NEPGR|nr:hypothetical protein Nepgr_022775 [Nepenthes gracilis]